MGQLKRQLGFFDLLVLGIAGAVGTGVLFSTAGMAAAAGPGVILAWFIGAVMYFFIALSYVDLASVYPEAGGPSRYSLYSYGKSTNLINAFADLIWYILIPPIEALATVEGVNYFYPHLVTTSGAPTTAGAILAIILMLIFLPFNYYGVRAFARSTNVLGIVKLLLYLLMAVGFIGFAHFANLGHYGGFMPFGVNGLFVAIPLGMFAFGGIRVIPDYAEEVRNKKSLLSSIVWTVIGQTILYVLLALGLITALDWGHLGIAAGHWALVDHIAGNPYLTIAHSAGVAWLIVIAAIIAILGPFVTGYIYQGSGSRVLMAMSRTGLVSRRMKEISKNTAIPIGALLAFTVVGVIVAYLTAPVPSIYSLINDAVVAGYMGFAVNPPVMIAMRRQGRQGFFKHATVIAVIAFACASAIIYWSGWPSVPYATVLLAIAVIVFGLIYRVKEHARHAIWYVVYILFMTAMTYAGNRGLFNIDVGTAIAVGVSVVIFLPWAVSSRLDQPMEPEREQESLEASGAR